jgi:NTE family protein
MNMTRLRRIDSVDVNARHQPPGLALVLGSGGVRSVAALGIADILAGEGIAPDLIVGCSSGALFGAVIAMQWPVDEALRTVSALWSAELTEVRRWRAYAQLVAPKLARFDAAFSMRDDRLIRKRLERGFGDIRIEDLRMPLRIAATDAASGAPTVIARGPLVPALRASMAVPFIFPSVEVDGRRLVDGVISDPLPLSAAADAQAVIALGFEGAMPRRVDRASRLVARTTTAMINNLQRAHVAAARAAGRPIVNLELALDRRVGLWETAALPYLFEAGRRAARARLPEIRALLSLPCENDRRTERSQFSFNASA